MLIARITDTGESVLIDTWWNVNTIDLFEFPFSIPVLIDTWWNVNAHTAYILLHPRVF